MTEAVQQAQRVAGLIPAKVRAIIYTVLGAAIALEAIWDIVEDGLEQKLLASLTALGFVLALGNTGD